MPAMSPMFLPSLVVVLRGVASADIRTDSAAGGSTRTRYGDRHRPRSASTRPHS
ncbi:hypothetical protein ABZ434_32035 [Streptomyces sp. NPDC005761]|uniref:hypothetical protein n=1 Tax=Streptomyces sp. NPDC005761 TaxID=3157066 RepID=UPI0033E35B49